MPERPDHSAWTMAAWRRRGPGCFRDGTACTPGRARFGAREDVLISHRIAPVSTRVGRRRSVEMFADNLDRWLAGAPLKNVVDPSKGY